MSYKLFICRIGYLLYMHLLVELIVSFIIRFVFRFLFVSCLFLHTFGMYEMHMRSAAKDLEEIRGGGGERNTEPLPG